MARKLEKRKCEICNNKYTPRAKTVKRGDLHIEYALCNTCGTVYPISATNLTVRQAYNRLEELREDTFAPGCTLSAEEKESNVREIQYLVNEIRVEIKKLIREYHPLFMTFGDRVRVVQW